MHTPDFTDSKYRVQVGYKDGAYQTRYCLEPDAGGRAALLYRGINVGNGYKKRLLHGSTVLLRTTSF